MTLHTLTFLLPAADLVAKGAAATFFPFGAYTRKLVTIIVPLAVIEEGGFQAELVAPSSL
jgi:hypothetical protein